MAEENSKGAVARRSKYLPEELQEKILGQLPVKSLIRFESVCRTWQSMFHSRPFVDLYGTRRRVFYNTAPDLRKKMAPRMSMVFLPRYNDPELCWRRLDCVFGPLSNGMYCLTSHKEYRDFLSINRGEIFLCNPSTHDYRAANCFSVDLYCLLSRKLLSNPCRAHFGFAKINSSSDWDYKVVVLISYGESLPSFISLVYSLQSGEWKRTAEYECGKTMVGDRKATEAFNIQGRRIIKICYPFELRPQRFLEGCWHWIAIGEDRSFNVLSFNFADEAYKLMGAPADYVTNESCSVKPVVSVLHDHLVVIYLSMLSYSVLLSHCVEVDVWMMMEYGAEESWTKMYRINPNFYGEFERHLGIEYRLVRDEESGSVRIESLSFSDCDKQQIDLLF